MASVSDTRALRILHVIDSGGLYGAERVLLGLAAECSRQGDEVYVGTIVSPEDDGDPLGDAAEHAGLNHVRFQMKDGFNIRGLGAILDFVRDQRISLIHTHGYKANILLGMASRRRHGAALICTLHGWTSRGKPGKLAVYEWLEQRIVRRFDGVVVVSEKLKEAIRHPRLNGRLVKISNSVDTGSLVGKSSPCNGSPNRARGAEGKLIFSAGRLSHEKGFDLLLSAILRLKRQGSKLHVVIAGEGPERAALESQIRESGLEDEVDLVGFQASLVDYYRDADLFVLSSRTEGLPLVLLEAMAHRVAVVATPVGEVAEVLNGGQCGFIASHVTADALAEAIQAALSGHDERMERIRQDARERVELRYSLKEMARKYRDVYQEALRRGN